MMLLSSLDKIDRLVLAVVISLLLLGPLVQGLFFPFQYLIVFFVAGCLVSIIITRNEAGWLKEYFSHPITLALFILICLYAVSAVFAGNHSLAILEFYRVLLGLPFLIIGVHYSQKGLSTLLIRVIVVSGVMVAVFGLLALALNDLLPGAVYEGRISSTFQYANALAMYMLLCYLLALSLWPETDTKGNFFVGTSLIILLLVLILSFSRGIWLILPFSLAYLLALSQKTLRKILVKPLAISFSGILVILLFSAAWSNQVFARINNINLGASEMQHRAAQYVDAFKIIADHPLLGIGGGNWSSVQYQYQSTHYYVSMVHNFFLQAGVDAGAGAMLLFMGILLYVVVRPLKSGEGFASSQQAVAVGAVVMGISLHSLIDFDLKFPAIANVFWLLVGMWISKPTPKKAAANLPKFLKTVVIAMFLFLMVVSLPLFWSEYYLLEGKAALNSQKYSEAAGYYIQSTTYNPWQPDGYAGLGLVNEKFGQASKKPSYFLNALKFHQKAIGLDPNNPLNEERYAVLLFKVQLFEESAKAFERAIFLQPFNGVNYENFALALYMAGETKLKSNPAAAKSIFLKVLAVEQKLAEAQGKVSAWKYTESLQPKNLNISPKLRDTMDKARARLSID